MVTVHQYTTKGRNTTHVITLESTKNFWDLVEKYEAPLKAREDLKDWDRDSRLAQFEFTNGEKIQLEYL